MESLEGQKGTLYRDDIQVEVHYTVNIITFFTPYDLLKYDIFGILSGAVFPVSFIVCLAVTSLLFYKNLSKAARTPRQCGGQNRRQRP